MPRSGATVPRTTASFTRPHSGALSLPLFLDLLEKAREGVIFTLTACSGEDERVFFFPRGAALFLATGPTGGDVLARRVERDGLMKPDHLDPLVAKSKLDRPLLQDVLVAAEAVDRDALGRLVAELVEEHLLEVGLWAAEGGAFYQFLAGNPPARLYDQDVPTVRVSSGFSALLDRVKARLAAAEGIVQSFKGSFSNAIACPAAADVGFGHYMGPDPRRLWRVLASFHRDGHAVFGSAEAVSALVGTGAVTVSTPPSSVGEWRARAAAIEGQLASFVLPALARMHLAAIFERLGDAARAAAEHREIALAYMAAGQFDAAAAALRRAIRLLPSDVAARELLIESLVADKRNADAAAESVALAQLYLDLGLVGRARGTLEKALELGFKGVGAVWMLTGALVALDEKDEAKKRALGLAEELEKSGDAAGALAAWQLLLELDPMNERARRAVDAATGRVRALAARWAVAATAVLALLLVVGWTLYELRALSAFRETRGAVTAALGESRFDVARASLHEFVAAWSLARTARAAQVMLGEVDAEERAVAEQACARAAREAAEHEQAGRIPEASSAWRAAGASERAARREPALAGIARCEARLKRATDALENARELDAKGSPERAHDALAALAASEPWLLASGDVRVPFEVDSTPRGARVLVDGVEQERPTPIVLRRRAAPFRLRVESRFTDPVDRELPAVPPWSTVVVLPRPRAWGAPAIPSAAPLALEKTVFVAGLDRALHALASSDGAPLWTAPLGPSTDASERPVASCGLVVVRGASGVLVALDAATGAPRWRRELAPVPGETEATLAACARGVVVRAGRRGLALVSPDGSVAWSVETGPGEPVGAPVVRGSLVVLAHERHLSSHDVSSGRTAWSRELPAVVCAGAVLGPRESFAVPIAPCSLALVENDGRVEAVRVLSEQPDATVTSCDGDGSTVGVGLSDGELVSVGVDGVRWRRVCEKARAVRWVVPAGADLLAGTGEVMVFFDQTGAEKWRHPTADGLAPAADRLHVYVGATEGTSALER